jgi:hypothetical protein
VLLTSPGLPEDEDYLRDLGGSEVLDRDADVAALVHERYPDSIEALLDLVSYAPEGFDTHAEVLKDDGRGASPLSAAGEGSEHHNVMAMPTQDNLERLGRMLEAGTLRVPIQNAYGLDQAREAMRALSTAHSGQARHSGSLSASRPSCSSDRSSYSLWGLQSLSWTYFGELRKREVRPHNAIAPELTAQAPCTG